MAVWRSTTLLLAFLLGLGCSASSVPTETRDAAAGEVDAGVCRPSGETCNSPGPDTVFDRTCCSGSCCGDHTFNPGLCGVRVGEACTDGSECCTGTCDGKCCIPAGRHCDGFEAFCCSGLQCVVRSGEAVCR